MKDVKRYARGTMTIALCGIKFFYERTMKQDWNVMGLVRTPRQKTLPVVLSPDEVRRLLAQVTSLWNYVCLSTIYSCGLWLQEGSHLQVGDIDGKRGFVHVHQGKGGKDRYVPLPRRTLELLREQWKVHRNPVWIFPAAGRDLNAMANADTRQNTGMRCCPESGRSSVLVPLPAPAREIPVLASITAPNAKLR